MITLSISFVLLQFVTIQLMSGNVYMCSWFENISVLGLKQDNSSPIAIVMETMLLSVKQEAERKVCTGDVLVLGKASSTQGFTACQTRDSSWRMTIKTMSLWMTFQSQTIIIYPWHQKVFIIQNAFSPISRTLMNFTVPILFKYLIQSMYWDSRLFLSFVLP